MNALSHTSDTTVDNKRVDDKILLKDNDLIEIGQRKFIFHSLSPGSAKVVDFTLDSLCDVRGVFGFIDLHAT